MNNSKKARIRQAQIRDLLLKKDVVTLQEFCQTFHASTATIRNDLTYLEKEGVLKRVIGGAVSCEGTPRNTGYHARINLFKEEKMQIAEYVANNLIKDNMTIALDAGTANQYIAQKLLEKDIFCKVISNSLNVMLILSKSSNIELYMAGGKLDKEHNSFHDEKALKDIKGMKSDLYFLSPNGLDLEAQISSSAKEEQHIKQELIHNADKVIVVADHSKFDKQADYHLLNLSDVYMVISDSALPKATANKYSEYIKLKQA